jgi:hypothetical protein
MTNLLEEVAQTENSARKRLSLDVFKEKAIGSEANIEQTGGTSWVCASLFISMALTLGGDTNDCHVAQN